MKNRLSILAFLLLTILCSCDKVNGPYEEVTTIAAGNRKVLIEDYTGHKCVNCPRAAETIKTLQQLRPGRIIAVGVHVTSQFAAPGSGIYNIDFRTSVGNSNDSLFEVSLLGLPTGMVNRLSVNGVRRIEYSNWGKYADSLLQLPAVADIKIENTYIASGRVVTSTIKSEFLSKMSGNYKLVAFLIEDSIPHAQKDNLIPPPSNDSDYVHNHVLRASLNGAFGELLNNGPVVEGSSFTKTYARAISANWREKKCAIVAFIYDDATKEILQAEEKEILE